MAASICILFDNPLSWQMISICLCFFVVTDCVRPKHLAAYWREAWLKVLLQSGSDLFKRHDKSERLDFSRGRRGCIISYFFLQSFHNAIALKMKSPDAKV